MSIIKGTLYDANNNILYTKSSSDLIEYGSNTTVKDKLDSIDDILSGKANSNHTHSYLPLSGGTLTGAVYNNMGYVSAINYGFYAGNNSSFYKILSVDDMDQCTISDNAFATYIYGSSVTVNKALHIGTTCLIHGHSLGFDHASYSTKSTIYTKWKDGSNHDLIGRSEDGLNSYIGWAGSASYASVLTLRSRTVKVSNASGTTNLSDERLKKDWDSLDRYDKFFDKISPLAYKYINGSSNRYHLGFGAQSIEKALLDSGLSTQDFGGIVKYKVDLNSEDYNGYDEEYGLVYSEFIALLVDQVQRLKNRVKVLENNR